MVAARGDGVVRPAGRGVEGGLSPWHDGQGGSRDRGEVPTLGVRLCWRQAARLRRRAQAWRTKESYKSSGPGHSEALTRSKCVAKCLVTALGGNICTNGQKCSATGNQRNASADKW